MQTHPDLLTTTHLFSGGLILFSWGGGGHPTALPKLFDKPDPIRSSVNSWIGDHKGAGIICSVRHSCPSWVKVHIISQ